MSLAVFFAPIKPSNQPRRPPPNKPSIPDPRIDQTDDQALGRPRSQYSRPSPNKPSIPDPRIDQTDNQALGRSINQTINPYANTLNYIVHHYHLNYIFLILFSYL